jgi:3-oxoacyl-[acyl-carrier protein] reductase
MTVSPLSLAGRVALVTGGGRGIGRAISLALATAGAAVAVNYRRDADAAAEVVELIGSTGGTARAYAATIGDDTEVSAMIAAVGADLGPVDLVVNNAGIASRGDSVLDTDPAEPARLMAVNAYGPHRIAQLVLPGMRAAGRGDFVFISSVAARLLSANGAPYNMAKAAMEALAITLAKEESRYGIRANVVAPGLVATEMGRRLVAATRGVELSTLAPDAPFGRVCTPEDIAGTVLFFVSGLAGYVTGQVLTVNGGSDPLVAG